VDGAGLDGLDDDRVLPGVAEVVDALERLPALHGVGEGDASFGHDAVSPVLGTGGAEANAAEDELVKMSVLPTHDGLDDPVQRRERDIAGDTCATPDRRIDVLERDRKLMDLVHDCPMSAPAPRLILRDRRATRIVD
jgi:hypothetical protein